MSKTEIAKRYNLFYLFRSNGKNPWKYGNHRAICKDIYFLYSDCCTVYRNQLFYEQHSSF